MLVCEPIWGLATEVRQCIVVRASGSYACWAVWRCQPVYIFRVQWADQMSDATAFSATNTTTQSFFFLYFTRQTSQAQSMPTVFIERPQHSSEHNGESFGIHTLGEFACLRECRIWGSRSESSGLSSLPTPRGGSGPASLDEGSDNGRPTDTDSPFDLSLARCPPPPTPLPLSCK